MSLLVDTSNTESLTTSQSQGFLTGLQKGTVIPKSSLTQNPSTFSYYFIYSSADGTQRQEHGVGVTSGSEIATETSIPSVLPSKGLSSLSQLILSDDLSSASLSPLTASNTVSTTSTNAGSSLSGYGESNSKLTLLIGTMVGLSVFLTTL